MPVTPVAKPVNDTHETHTKYKKPKVRSTQDVGSLSKIKKRIRDVQRTLKKGARTAKIRVESERRIRALEYELGEKTIDAQEQKNATSYHKVKHIERKKAERRLVQAETAYKEASEKDKEAALKQVEERKIDVLYTKHFPKTLPYISLITKESNETREEVRQKIRESLAAEDDFKDMYKYYRDQCRTWLVKRGQIPAAKPVDVDEEPVKEDDNENSDGEKEIEMSKKDDFFE
ncbi:hypothetical protein BDF14DRAFT_1791908 [Spinellus fusiger]|nr:hypothetical protein BDF14DRAFT_1791908 [Spinellus fusiger]